MTDKAQNSADRLLTSWEIAQLLQVNPTSINNWIEAGRIPAFRTPGGHRRVRVSDLISFLDAHRMPVPKELEEAPKEQTKLRVLWVDDNSPYLRSLGRLFRPYRDDADFMFVENGIDALLQVGTFKPHVIVLDVFMPGLDGIEVCRRLRERPETKATEIIVTSANMSPELEAKALEAGAKKCFTKPMETETVLHALGLKRPEPQRANRPRARK